MDKTWTKIWNLKVPPKVKIFIWKMAQDSIACEANLTLHHMPTNPRCVICGYHWSNTTHAFIFCQRIKEIWKNEDCWYQIKELKDLQSKDLLFTLESIMARPTFEELCTKIWGVWKDRCTFSHSPNNRAPIYQKGCRTHWTKAFLASYRKMQTNQPPRPGTHDTNYGCSPSHEGYTRFSAYVDAAFNDEALAYAMVVVIYDSGVNVWAAGY